MLNNNEPMPPALSIVSIVLLFRFFALASFQAQDWSSFEEHYLPLSSNH